MKQQTHTGSRTFRILCLSFNKTSRNAERRLQNVFVSVAHWAKRNRFQVLLVGIISLLILFSCVKINISEVLFGEENKARGELLKFVVAGVVGSLVVWGLSINNRRMKEQTRQNEIAEQGQINTRFKDAAMLLNGGESSSILSGVYALHSIAQDAARNKKNVEYVEIIHDIFCAILREKNAMELYNHGRRLAPVVVTQSILNVLFGDRKSIYKYLRSDLSGCVFQNLHCSNLYLENVDFVNSKFEDVTFMNYQLKDATFVGADLERVSFAMGKMSNVQFLRAKLSDIVFGQAFIERVSFYEAVFRNVDFGSTILQSVAFEHTPLADIPYPQIVKKGKSLELTRATMLF